jgi:signal peptidase I
MLIDTTGHPSAPPVRIVASQSLGPRARVGRAKTISSIVLASVILLVLVAVAGIVLGIWRFTVIDTGSMRPTLDPGDVTVLTSERTSDLSVGQIVAFHLPGEPRLTVVHRVLSRRLTPRGIIIQTKGDANRAPDSWRALIVGRTVWRESLRAPKLGYLAVWSEQRPVRFGVLLVIVIAIMGMWLGAIWRPR